jgi:hypothetical protein
VITTGTWAEDVELLLRWTERDEKALEKARAKLTEEERAVIDAVVETRGEPRALAERLGPIVLAKLKARGIRPPERLREPAAKAWNAVKTPLKLAWRPPAKADPAKLAEAFADRYSARLETLTKEGAAAAHAAATLAEGLRAAGATKELLAAATELQVHVQQLRSAATSCVHPEGDRTRWLADVANLAREATEMVDLAQRLGTGLRGLHEQADALAASLREWVDAPPRERAARAESMAVRVRAARDAAIAMHEDFLGLIFA